MKIKIDLDKCHMSGECYYNHPKFFKMGSDGHPELLIQAPSSDAEKLEAEQAVEVCPAQAISLHED